MPLWIWCVWEYACMSSNSEHWWHRRSRLFMKKLQPHLDLYKGYKGVSIPNFAVANVCQIQLPPAHRGSHNIILKVSCPLRAQDCPVQGPTVPFHAIGINDSELYIWDCKAARHRDVNICEPWSLEACHQTFCPWLGSLGIHWVPWCFAPMGGSVEAHRCNAGIQTLTTLTTVMEYHNADKWIYCPNQLDPLPTHIGCDNPVKSLGIVSTNLPFLTCPCDHCHRLSKRTGHAATRTDSNTGVIVRSANASGTCLSLVRWWGRAC